MHAPPPNSVLALPLSCAPSPTGFLKSHTDLELDVGLGVVQQFACADSCARVRTPLSAESPLALSESVMRASNDDDDATWSDDPDAHVPLAVADLLLRRLRLEAVDAAALPLDDDTPLSAVAGVAQALAGLFDPTPGAFPLATLHPDLAHCHSFDDLLVESCKFGRCDPMQLAATAASVWARQRPDERIPMAAVEADATAVAVRGLVSVLQDRFQALARTSVQPTMTLKPDVPPSPVPKVPPYPTQARFAAGRNLAQGGSVLLTDQCAAPSVHIRPCRDPLSELATERLVSKDYRLGRALILPLAQAVASFTAVGLPLRVSPDFIAVKGGGLQPEGRLVVDLSQSGLNHPTKKPLLADLYGPIAGALPVLADFCELAESSFELFRDHPDELVCSSTDCDSWFRRVRVRPTDVGQFCHVVYLPGPRGRLEPYLVFSQANPFGAQDANYPSQFLTDVIAANDRADDVSHYGRPVSLMYSDDDNAILPRSEAAPRRARHTANVSNAVGDDPVNLAKNCDSVVGKVIGCVVDLGRRHAALSHLRFLKMLQVLFFELPLSTKVGDRVRVATLQRAAAYMMQGSAVVLAGRPFCRAMYSNIAHAEGSFVHLSCASFGDLITWRAIMLLAWSDARVLVRPISVIATLRRRRDETYADWSCRMADRASVVINGDSAGCGWATPGTFGSGFSIRARRAALPSLLPLIGWASWEIDHFRVLSKRGVVQWADNNFYEFLSALLALDGFCSRIDRLESDGTVDPPAPPPTPTALPPPRHVHVWTDNTAALSWMVKHKARSPLHAFCLHLSMSLQVRHNLVVTWGHVKGVDNGLGDAPSRGFRGPNGALIRALLAGVPRIQALPPWLASMRTIEPASSLGTWQDAVSLLMRQA